MSPVRVWSPALSILQKASRSLCGECLSFWDGAFSPGVAMILGGCAQPWPWCGSCSDWRAGACCACAQHRGVIREGVGVRVLLAILPPRRGGPPLASDRGVLCLSVSRCARGIIGLLFICNFASSLARTTSGNHSLAFRSPEVADCDVELLPHARARTRNA